ncbi:serine/threonine-protein kinase [Dactylosporangium darangshiense]|uniref:serine/threonine-protein kinase n=1 Tax=Dactylosporangium darangshiense TaxID=579108 RepID=UPI00363A95BD
MTQLRIDRYRLDRVIGTGGMSRVWLAHDDLLDRPVAVKEILPVAGLDVAAGTRTVAEARAAARLAHPNVVRVYDVLLGGGRAWIIMEHVPCRDLEALVRERGPLPPAEAARVGLAVLTGLDAAHRAGVLHRDVKPHNVLIADDGRILLGDFGVALLADRVQGPESGPLVASPGYVAPERARDGESSAAGDLWSFGATLYFCLEARPPFARPTAAEQLAALFAGPPDPMVNAGPLEPVVAELLQVDPARRPSAIEAAERIRALQRVHRSPAVVFVAWVMAFALLGGIAAALLTSLA